MFTPVSTSTRTNLRETPPEGEAQKGPVFATTRWAAVLLRRHDTTHATAALERLCQIYWRPLYVHERRRGHSVADAQDQAQDFFARLLMGLWLDRAGRQRGKFRSFLLSAMNHFLADEWDRKRASHIVFPAICKAGGVQAKTRLWPDAGKPFVGQRMPKEGDQWKVSGYYTK